MTRNFAKTSGVFGAFFSKSGFEYREGSVTLNPVIIKHCKAKKSFWLPEALVRKGEEI